MVYFFACTWSSIKYFASSFRKDGRYYAVDFTLTEIKSLRVLERKNPTTGHQVFPGRFRDGKTIFRVSFHISISYSIDSRTKKTKQKLFHDSLKVPSFVEFLDLIAGLRKSTGRTSVGIYPEIKHPDFHYKEQKNITEAVLTTLKTYNYTSRYTDQFLLHGN